MFNLFTYFSPEQKAARLEKKLKKAIAAKNQQKVDSIFSNELILLLKEKKAKLLSNLIITYINEINNNTLLGNKITSVDLKNAVILLDESQYENAALKICDCFGFDNEAIKLLAKQGMANELTVLITKNEIIDKEFLQTAVIYWEKYNGDIRESPTLVDIIKKIADFSKESIPDNPRVKEIIGQFKEAAILYVKENDLVNAAKCYEKAEMYHEACKIYKYLRDNEGVSKAAECLKDYENALKYAVNPQRKVKLLITMERFSEAREFAAGLDSPDEYFNLIKSEAKRVTNVKIKSHDFTCAVESAYEAEFEPSEIEEILSLGRQYFDSKLASATSQDEIKSIYKDRVNLEEKGQHFEEAGKIAEEVLNDLELASLLYEKANLFNLAITAASGIDEQSGKNDTKIRLAELHEKGGNLLSAANLYKSAQMYDKAYSLYENLQHFSKAIECYLKTSNPSQDVLIHLYTSSGQFEKVIEIYLGSGTFSDLEKALSIAKINDFTSHIKVIQKRISKLFSGTEEDLIRLFTQARDEIISSYSPVFGIDFGTTNSVSAIFNNISKDVEIIPTSIGTDFEPSFFGVDENNRPIFGEAARLRSLTAPHSVIARVKRTLGYGRSFSINEKKYRSEEIVAKILQRIKFNAEEYLKSKIEARFYDLLQENNLKFPEESLTKFLSRQERHHIKEAVLSVPAYFNNNQKRATRDSAEIAGLRIRRLLHEPTAAALAYGYQKQYSGKIMVLDLGGGTFDISILDVGGGVYDIKSIGGDTQLGGSDIDAELVQHVIKNIKLVHGIYINEKTHPIEIARLRDACEKMKIHLSSVNEYTMELRHFLNLPAYTFTMKRSELETLSKSILDRIKTTVEKTMNDYGSKIDHFLLVGNASKMPVVSYQAEKIIRAKQLKGIDHGTVVSTGTALEGAIISGNLTQTLLLDIVPHSLGIAVIKKNNNFDEKEINRLIDKNSIIPVKKSNVYSTKEDNQSNVHIEIFQGESLEPQKNFYLGDFILKGILPAPAGSPQIEVKFEIDVDCILTVTAVDKVTGNNHSIMIEGAVTLSPKEKDNIIKHFRDSENIFLLEKYLGNIKSQIEFIKTECEKTIQEAERTIKDFFELFHETVEVNPQLYKVNMDQTSAIQNMFIQKDQFVYGIPNYRDQFASIINNIKQTEMKHLDFSDKDIVTKLQNRYDILSNYKNALDNLIESIEINVINIVVNWIQILKSIEPSTEKMNTLEISNYHLTAGRPNEARKILEFTASSAEGLTKESFNLLLKCYVQLGLREEYRDLHKRIGNLFGINYPDFYRLNTFLDFTDDSVFMVKGISQHHGPFSGSGFCIAPNLIVTCRHVIEGAELSSIKIVGKNRTYSVDDLEFDQVNDLAILRISDNLKPFRLGEFNFVDPGEQVVAIGFPSPSSEVHSENIYISKGIVNSIRRIDISSERVIFIDAKIGSGMSGCPLVNDLGEVVGIITLIRYQIGHSKHGIFAVEDQPVALPIHLVRKFLLKYESKKNE